MTYASLFSGAGGFDIGLDRAGLECQFQCEIDPQASKVLARHWPDVPKHTDVREVQRKHAPRVDLVVGGFPCQDLSVAGKREGLKGERSGLFYELLRVVTLCKPDLVLWENVPGLLSSDDGRDFGRVLRGLADIGYFGAWRVLDAQFFGVAQRRRRVFGVFARGRGRARRSAEVLALTEGGRRDTEKSRQAGQGVAFTLTSSVGRSRHGTRIGNAWNTNFVAATITGGRKQGGYNARDESGLIAARCQTSRGNRNDGETDNFVCVTGARTHTLTAVGFDGGEDGTGRGSPIVPAGAGVRRMTPREWERLMSWPDDHTRYDDAGNEFADGPRYRMAGNGVVSNCAEWIGRRLSLAEV